MNQTQVMVRIVEMAKVGGAMPLQEAVTALAAVIDHLDMSDTYEADAAALLGVGAAIWELSSGPGGGHDPEWGPPSLRP